MHPKGTSSTPPPKISPRRAELLSEGKFRYQPHRGIFVSYALQKVLDVDAAAALPLRRLQAFLRTPRPEGLRAEFLWKRPQRPGVEEEITTSLGWR